MKSSVFLSFSAFSPCSSYFPSCPSSYFFIVFSIPLFSCCSSKLSSPFFLVSLLQSFLSLRVILKHSFIHFVILCLLYFLLFYFGPSHSSDSSYYLLLFYISSSHIVFVSISSSLLCSLLFFSTSSPFVFLFISNVSS